MYQHRQEVHLTVEEPPPSPETKGSSSFMDLGARRRGRVRAWGQYLEASPPLPPLKKEASEEAPEEDVRPGPPI